MSSWPLVKPWAVSGEDADGPCLACLFCAGIVCTWQALSFLFPCGHAKCELMAWTYITDTTLLLVSWECFFNIFFFCWWPTSCVNEGKQADKLHTISMYSSKAQWLLKCSLFRHTGVTTSILLLVACLDNSADCNQTIKYQCSSLCMLWICSGEVLTYLCQSPWLTWTKWPSVPFSSLSFLCENAPLSCWERDSVHRTSWYAVPACIPLQMLFLRITKG